MRHTVYQRNSSIEAPVSGVKGWVEKRFNERSVCHLFRLKAFYPVNNVSTKQRMLLSYFCGSISILFCTSLSVRVDLVPFVVWWIRWSCQNCTLVMWDQHPSNPLMTRSLHNTQAAWPDSTGTFQESAYCVWLSFAELFRIHSCLCVGDIFSILCVFIPAGTHCISMFVTDVTGAICKATFPPWRRAHHLLWVEAWHVNLGRRFKEARVLWGQVGSVSRSPPAYQTAWF